MPQGRYNTDKSEVVMNSFLYLSERNSATSPYGQCSVPTTEQQIPTSYGNGEIMYP